jgi:hypothetical protein
MSATLQAETFVRERLSETYTPLDWRAPKVTLVRYGNPLPALVVDMVRT